MGAMPGALHCDLKEEWTLGVEAGEEVLRLRVPGGREKALRGRAATGTKGIYMACFLFSGICFLFVSSVSG